jgi:hypothetical protein
MGSLSWPLPQVPTAHSGAVALAMADSDELIRLSISHAIVPGRVSFHGDEVVAAWDHQGAPLSRDAFAQRCRDGLKHHAAWYPNSEVARALRRIRLRARLLHLAPAALGAVRPGPTRSRPRRAPRARRRVRVAAPERAGPSSDDDPSGPREAHCARPRGER